MKPKFRELAHFITRHKFVRRIGLLAIFVLLMFNTYYFGEFFRIVAENKVPMKITPTKILINDCSS